MLATREWWNGSRHDFDTYTSDIVLDEAFRGDAQAAAERLDAIVAISLAPVTDAAMQLAERLVARSALPLKARVDAAHVAVAATNALQFLLTWNCRHLANATLRAKIEEVCREQGFDPPIICTPFEFQRGAAMMDDPIVDEVHRIREQMLAEYGGDLRALMKAAQRRTEDAARAGRKVMSPAPRNKLSPAGQTPRKVG